MNEPSVLDYVKAKLAFWRHSPIALPPMESKTPAAEAVSPQVSAALASAGAAAVGASAMAEAEPALAGAAAIPGGEGLAENAAYADAAAALSAAADAAAVADTAAPTYAAAPTVAAATSASGFLLAMTALALAIIAQGFLEPPNRATTPAAIFYALSAVVIGIAYFRGFVAPAAPSADMEAPAALRLRPEGLIVGLILLVLAFFTFATPRDQETATFNFINTSLWLLSIGYLVWTFYLPRYSSAPPLRQRIGRFLARPTWKIAITRWTVIVLAAIALILFFRFFRLNSVPMDAVSDHAEKLLDVNDVLNGQFRVFFPRNTGREAFQFFWTALIVNVFNTGVTFLSLKIGIAIIGLLALYYMYRLGELLGNRWVGLLAVVFCGFSYWAQTQARIALRFSLYPGFFAPMLYYLIRGLRNADRNDFIWAGIWMGFGLHGYTSYRIVPFVAVAGFVIYMLHHRSAENRRFAIYGLGVLALLSLAVFMPLFRFTLDRPEMVAFRSMTRLGSLERPLPGSPVAIFLQNTWNALVMFFWDNGDVWVHSIPHRPAMDVITAGLFFLGVVLVLLRYIRKRSWTDLFLLAMIPMLLLPSIFSLAFPNENPNLNRTAAAYVPAFLLVGIALEALLEGIRRGISGRLGVGVACVVGLVLVGVSASNNFDLVFNKYDLSERESGWNSAEMGAVVRQFAQSIGRGEDAWVVPYDYWVDTRLVGMEAGYPTRDMAIPPDQLALTQDDPRNKLFIVNPQDTRNLDTLKTMYPQGRYWTYTSGTPGKDFLIFFVPARSDMLQEGAVVPPQVLH